MVKSLLALLFWPLLAFAQTVTLTWDAPPVSFPVWYVTCVSQTVNSPCLSFSWFQFIPVTGVTAQTQYVFDEAQMKLPLGSNYCLRVAAVKYYSWPWGDWSYPVCTTYTQ